MKQTGRCHIEIDYFCSQSAACLTFKQENGTLSSTVIGHKYLTKYSVVWHSLQLIYHTIVMIMRHSIYGQCHGVLTLAVTFCILFYKCHQTESLLDTVGVRLIQVHFFS